MRTDKAPHGTQKTQRLVFCPALSHAARLFTLLTLELFISFSTGPAGAFRGYFRAPVTSNYSFILASDDSSQLWVGQNESSAMLAIDFKSWVNHREYGLDWEWSGSQYTPQTRVDLYASRVSKKYFLKKGEFLYLSAIYISGLGGDSFSLATKMHATSTGRKDSPHAVDEKQSITLTRSAPSPEQHLVAIVPSLAGRALSGTFTLSVGGAVTRPIQHNATAQAVAAALREMMGSCSGTVGSHNDGGGNSLDCVVGRGTGYRGLANTHSKGQQCANWRVHPSWHPRLALLAGLESNYCRNPDASISPWCYDKNGIALYCDSYNRCGLTLQDRATAPFIQTFEDEVDTNQQYTNGWSEIEGVKPVIVEGDAFCGKKSLYVPNGYSRLRTEYYGELWDGDKDLNNNPTSLSKFPYMCMAYKIPAASVVAMRVRLRVCKWSKAQAGCEDIWRWRTIDMTNAQPSTFDKPTNGWETIGNWGIINDGAWHHTCVNVLQMISLNDKELREYNNKGDAYLHEVEFFPKDSPKGTYGSSEFWIDEFSFSATPREVKQKAQPLMGGARVAHVERVDVVGGGVTWRVNITYDDCTSSMPLGLLVNASGIRGDVSGETHSVVVGPPAPFAATVSVSKDGKVAEWGAFAPASEVRDKLAPLLGDTKVLSFGTCAERGWEIHMLDAAGDQPLMTVSASGNANVVTETVEEGGLVMGPIPVDYVHRVVQVPQAIVTANEGAAKCKGDACKFVFDQSLSPEMTGLAASTIPMWSNGTGASLTISGSKLAYPPSGALPVVRASGMPCLVGSASPSSITCSISACLPTGFYGLSVTVPGRGLAAGSLSFNVSVTVASVWPASIDSAAPAVIRLLGGGFSEDPASNNVTIGGLTCATINSTCSSLFCMYPGSGSRRAASDLSVSVSVNGAPVTAIGLIGTGSAVSFAPSVSSIDPTQGSAGGGTLLTVSGANLAGGVVTAGGWPCKNVDATSNGAITCTTGPGAVGANEVVVRTINGSAAGPAFHYQLAVLAVDAVAMGLGGGIGMTLTGEGLISGDGKQARVRLEILGREVYVFSHYAPPQIREAQDLSLLGTAVDDVQELRFFNSPNATYQGDVGISWFGRTLGFVPRDVNQYVLERTLAAVVPPGGRVRVSPATGALPGYTRWTVLVSGLLGDVPRIELACRPDISACNPLNMSSVEITPGSVTSGWFTLATSNASGAATVAVPANATTSDLQGMLAQIGVDADVTSVPPSVTGVLRTWRVTYKGFVGIRPLLSAQRSNPVTNYTLTPGGDVSVKRVTPGTGMPTGKWAITLGGRSTAPMPLNVTEDEVKSAVKASFSELASVTVASADDAPGPLANRFYPRQWVVSFLRPGVAGPGIERCTDPRYIDWDPAVCPDVAGDLFLAFYDYYWPSGLSRPGDLGTPERKGRFLRACAQEAMSLNLAPAAECQALIPSETLAVCGVGSGKTPPCWEDRFSVAAVRHRDGTRVSYMRDDSATPSDFEKGYRFWRQLGLKELQDAQKMSANATVAITGYAAGAAVGALAGVSSRLASSKASETVTYNATSTSATQMAALSPRVTRHARNLPQIIRDDALVVPLATWRLGSMPGDGVARVAGALPQDDDGAAGFLGADDLHAAFSPTFNPAGAGTVEIWAKPTGPQSAGVVSSLVRSVGADAASGYALVIDDDGKPLFLLGTGNASAAPPLGARGGMIVFAPGAFTECKGSAALAASAWTHIAGVWTGASQLLYVDGVLVCSASLGSEPASNIDGDVVFGSGCVGANASLCADSTHRCSPHPACTSRCVSGCASAVSGTRIAGDFIGELDDAVLYSRALSPATIAMHASADAEKVMALVGAELNGISSECRAASCLVEFSAMGTPSLASASPSMGWQSASILVRGQGFAAGMTVKIGGSDCAVSGTPSSTEVTCTVGAALLGPGTVTVFVPGKGNSANSLPFVVASQVTEVTPTRGSLVGGTLLTIAGQGLQPGVVRVSVGPHLCEVVGIVSANQVTCRLPRYPSPYPESSSALPVTVTVEGIASSGKKALFAPADAFSIGPSASPMKVTSGTELTISGTGLPTDSPEITVGGVTCPVTGTPSATSVSCTVGPGAGGSYRRVSVRYAAGYAQNAAGSDVHVYYTVSVTSVTAGTVGRYGGQKITVAGAGFSAVPRTDNYVFLGGRPCEVVSATSNEIIVLAPPEARPPTAGIERYAGAGGNTGYKTCVARLLGVNATDVSVSHVVDTETVAAVPRGQVAGAAWRLTDGDPNTVWTPRDLPAPTPQKFVLDLGDTTQTVHAVTIQWESVQTLPGPPRSAIASLEISSDCAPGTRANLTTLQDSVTALREPVAGRYVVITFPLVPGRAIRNIVVSTEPLSSAFQSLSVDVRGARGPTCSSGCGVFYANAPSLISVSPAKAFVGDAINVTASLLESCDGVAVSVGGVPCAASACVAGGYVICTVPAVRGGTHQVTMASPSLGYAGRTLSGLAITVAPRISAVTPTAVGPGGGTKVMITGSGFSPGAGLVRVCGAPCVVNSSSHDLIICTQSAYGDRSEVPERSLLDAQVASGSDDAVEFVVGGGIDAASGSLGFNLVNSDKISIQRAFLRMRVDVPGGAAVTEARLHLFAEGPSCTKSAVLRIKAEAADDASPIKPWSRGSLSARKMGSDVLWQTDRPWMWAQEDQESADISRIVQEVVNRPGWRAGAYMLFLVEQVFEKQTYGSAPCRILSAEAGFPGKLRVSFTSQKAGPAPSGACNVTVSGGQGTCAAGVMKGRATASSADVVSAWDAKEAYPKSEAGDGENLTWNGARILCDKHVSRLCFDGELFDRSQAAPFTFVGMDRSDGEFFTPYYRFWGAPLSDVGQWMNVKTGAIASFKNSAENAGNTKLVACCMGGGHPASMAADGDDVTFWRSAIGPAQATLTLELDDGGGVVDSVVVSAHVHLSDAGRRGSSPHDGPTATRCTP